MSTLFCSNCGHNLLNNTAFCSECGIKVSGENLGQPISAQSTQNAANEAVLSIVRESWSTFGLAEFIIKLNGIELGRINDGEQHEFRITPGTYEIQIKMAYSFLGESSPKTVFTVLPNECIKFSCRPAYGFWGLMLGVKRLYYLTIGRKSFIVLKKHL